MELYPGIDQVVSRYNCTPPTAAVDDDALGRQRQYVQLPILLRTPDHSGWLAHSMSQSFVGSGSLELYGPANR